MLTDWADRSQIPKEATMPLHYGAARYEHSLRTKRILRLAMDKLLDDEAWETTPPSRPIRKHWSMPGPMLTRSCSRAQSDLGSPSI